MRATQLATGAALLVSLTHAASAAVWGFGDSNLDNGWFTTAPYSGEPKFDMYLSQAAQLGIGKETNNPGPMSIEMLASALRMIAAQPANKPGGTNFATSGAKNVNPNATTAGFPNAVPTATQVNNYLATHVPGPNDVFLIDSGANDVNLALTLDPTNEQIYLLAAAGGLANTIELLQNKGAAHLIVVNQPEGFGSPAARDARRVYNAALRSSLASAHVTYAWGDRNRVRQDIVANPGTFRMQFTDNTEAHQACPGGPEAGFGFAWALVCSANSPVIKPTPFAQQTLFADDGHWASNGQAVLASYYYCVVRVNWPNLIPPPLPPISIRPAVPYSCAVFSEFAPVRLP